MLIDMFGNNPSRNEVCTALMTLTHQQWCDGSPDPFATRRQWRRRWNENRPRVSISGPDRCSADPAETFIAATPVFAPERSVTAIPRVSSVSPTIVGPDSVLAVFGYALGLKEPSAARVLFVRDDVEQAARISGSGRAVSHDPDHEFQYMDVLVPPDLRSGSWKLVIEANGHRSTPVSVKISDVEDLQLTGISPPRLHPAQGIFLRTRTPARAGDHVQLTDARGQQWRIATGLSSVGVGATLPDEVADGEASVRLTRTVNGDERLGPPLTFSITSDPLPLKPLAVAGMRPVSPGQWTDLVLDHEIEFEVRRVDRIDVEFTQNGASATSRATGPDNVHVRVPARLKTGAVSVRTRTWIERRISEWSVPTEVMLTDRSVPASVTSIEAGPLRSLVWWSGDGSPAFVEAGSGEVLVLRGQFPVAHGGDLRLRLRAGSTTLELRATDVLGGVRVVLPSSASAGDWRLVVGAKDRHPTAQEIATVRVRK